MFDARDFFGGSPLAGEDRRRSEVRAESAGLRREHGAGGAEQQTGSPISSEVFRCHHHDQWVTGFAGLGAEPQENGERRTE